jgi:hypothetical protein
MFCFRAQPPEVAGQQMQTRQRPTGQVIVRAHQARVRSKCQAHVRVRQWGPHPLRLPGGLAAKDKSLQILRRTTNLRTNRLPMVCAHFSFAKHIPVPRSARSTAGSALWSTLRFDSGRIRNTTRLVATCASLMLAPVPQVEPSARKSDARRGS